MPQAFLPLKLLPEERRKLEELRHLHRVNPHGGERVSAVREKPLERVVAHNVEKRLIERVKYEKGTSFETIC